MKDEAKNVAAVTADYAVKDALGVEDGGLEARGGGQGRHAASHFIPDRRERLLAALDLLGQPQDALLDTRLRGQRDHRSREVLVVPMCATFCPTGAIAKYADGSIGATHRPVDCVAPLLHRHLPGRRGSSCPDEVFAVDLLSGAKERYPMKPRKNCAATSPDLALHEGSACDQVYERQSGALGWRTEGKESFPQNVSRETPVKERMFTKHPDSTSRPTPASEALRARFASPDPSCNDRTPPKETSEGVVATSGYCSRL